MKFLSAFLVSTSLSVAQTVTVIDSLTEGPIPGVTILSDDPSAVAVTDSAGQADISVFRNSGEIEFSHLGYRSVILGYAELGKKPLIVMQEVAIPFEEITVSASRLEDDRRSVPTFITTIHARDAALREPQTSADMLSAGVGVYVQKSQLAGGSPMLRGFATNRVLLVVDGVRMNNAIFRSGNLHNVLSLDAATIRRTEILFGPGAVLYGSDAIGGVMDFSTVEPRFSQESVQFAGNGLVRFATANRERTAHATVLVELPWLASATAVTTSSFGDLRAGTRGNVEYLRPSYQERLGSIDVQHVNPDPSLQVHSGYRQWNVLQKVRLRPASLWDLQYALLLSTTSDAPRYDRLTLDADGDGWLDFAEWNYGPQRWLMNRLSVSQTDRTVFSDHIRLTAAIQNVEESRHDRRMGNIWRRSQTETVDAFSVNLDIRKMAGYGMTVAYGAEVLINRIGSEAVRTNVLDGSREPTTTRYPDGALWESYGVYARTKIPLSRILAIDGGVRYTVTSMSAQFDTARFPFPFAEANNRSTALNGSFGFVLNPDRVWNVYANISTGFRSPNIDDMGKVFESEPGSIVVPNPALAPEYAYNFELGAGLRFPGRLEAYAALFYTYLDNAIARRDFQYQGQDSILYNGRMSRVQALRNIADAVAYGFQAEVKIDFGGGFHASSAISFQRGIERNDGNRSSFPLRHVAPPFGSSRVSYEEDDWKIELSLLYNAGMKFRDLPLSERNDPYVYARDAAGNPFVPGWSTLNLRGSISITYTLTLNVGVENITDRLYRPYASGISAPGRSLIVAMRGEF